MLFSELIHTVNGKKLRLNKDYEIEEIFIDSRQVIKPSERAVFFAVKGEHHDGRKFIRELYEKGLRCFVTDDELPSDILEKEEINIVRVSNSIEALQKVAARHRNSLSCPVVAVTGSNGKTIVKEWLVRLTSVKFNVIGSPKSYNSQVGVPLSVLAAGPEHTLGIFEAGISKVGEMEKLEKLLKPTIGIFTNIGSAHDEGFASNAEKIREKLVLFKHCKTLIYCKDHSEIHREIKNTGFKDKNLITWSRKEEADLTILDQHNHGGKEVFLKCKFESKKFEIKLPFTNDVFTENALHCITACLHLGISPEDFQEKLLSLKTVPMRLERIRGINRCTVIDDTYNNDLVGLEKALEFAVLQSGNMKKTLILSDLAESGMPSNELYNKVSDLLRARGFNRFIGIGKEINSNQKVFFENATFYTDTNSFLKDFDESNFHDELILVKGARTFGLEKIIARLRQKTHGTVLEINLNALTHNLNYFRNRLRPKTKIMVMVKALAYGSGSEEITQWLQYQRVDYLGVAYADEGIELRKSGITLPIMVMNPSDDSFDQLLDYKLEPVISGFELLSSLAEFLEIKQQTVQVHIEIDTGMRRLGFEPSDSNQLTKMLKHYAKIQPVGIFAHLAGADEVAHDDFTRRQISAFEKFALEFEATIGKPVIKHILNSAGILRFPEAQFDMIRLGIGLYGIEPGNRRSGNLRVVGTLKSIVSQIKKLKAGDTVGYGRKGKVNKATDIAVIAAGYADGYDRRFSNGKVKVLINNKLAPVIGNVCMDMTMADVTGIAVKPGDEVILFGENPHPLDLAEAAGTFPYEMLTNIGSRVKRIFYSE